ncbi:hypothetical protein CAPTEDRAFT_185050 [Capitella teleta]|uniref:Spondin domain-containing protein n=1 Tax=Capitella teleta TaxID=283909 RepID=R7VIP9_CAPTE|nr:hypothetical protein CAPTEDRAFT_185050 [Capitella teleta]|eukprot:ELU18432.1 hypothetical protein CAPTEDRAFT_185050 [Capitella teleta]
MDTILLSVVFLVIADWTMSDYLPGLDLDIPSDICLHAWDYNAEDDSVAAGSVYPSPYTITTNVSTYIAGQAVKDVTRGQNKPSRSAVDGPRREDIVCRMYMIRTLLVTPKTQPHISLYDIRINMFSSYDIAQYMLIQNPSRDISCRTQ